MARRAAHFSSSRGQLTLLWISKSVDFEHLRKAIEIAAAAADADSKANVAESGGAADAQYRRLRLPTASSARGAGSV